MRQTPTEPLDDRLTSLLSTEQRLEARSLEAERSAKALVEAARQTLGRAQADAMAELELEAAAEERAALDAHTRALEAIETERTAALTRLGATAPSLIDELCSLVLARLLEPGGGP